MRNLPLLNFPAFDAARDRLFIQGWDVISPADLDREAGFDPVINGYDFASEEFMKKARKRDIAAIEDRADALCLLPGWENSDGARGELWYANWKGIPIYTFPSMLLAGNLVTDFDAFTVHTGSFGTVNVNKKPGKIPEKLLTALSTSHTDESGLKDSGERREFASGSVRDMAEGKGMPSLMPILALIALSQHFEKGCKKYGKRNWEQGQPYSSFYESADRHMKKWFGGAEDEDHLVAYVWNAICQRETDLRVKKGILPKELDDRGVVLFDENGE